MAVIQPGVWIQNATTPQEAGSLGFIAARADDTALKGPFYIISNAHVMAPGNADPDIAGEILTGDFDIANHRMNNPTSIAKLIGRTSLGDGQHKVDAAIAEVINPALVQYGLKGVGPFTGVGRNLGPGRPVYLKGAGDQRVRRGSIYDIVEKGAISIPGRDGESLNFTDIALCKEMSEPGDSGSAVMDRQGKILGLLFGLAQITRTNETLYASCFCRIENVMKAVSKFVGRDLEIITTPDKSIDLESNFNGPAITGDLPAITSLRPALSAPHLEDPYAPLVSAAEVDREAAIDVLARTLWGEARGEIAKPNVGERGYWAIAEVVVNRAKRRTGEEKPGPIAIARECVRPCQFSCWNDGNDQGCPKRDPNLDALLAVDRTDAAFETARKIAFDVVADGRVTELTQGARHYFNASAIEPPQWAAQHTPVATIGAHVFFNDID